MPAPGKQSRGGRRGRATRGGQRDHVASSSLLLLPRASYTGLGSLVPAPVPPPPSFVHQSPPPAASSRLDDSTCQPAPRTSVPVSLLLLYGPLFLPHESPPPVAAPLTFHQERERERERVHQEKNSPPLCVYAVHILQLVATLRRVYILFPPPPSPFRLVRAVARRPLPLLAFFPPRCPALVDYSSGSTRTATGHYDYAA